MLPAFDLLRAGNRQSPPPSTGYTKSRRPSEVEKRSALSLVGNLCGARFSRRYSKCPPVLRCSAGCSALLLCVRVPFVRRGRTEARAHLPAFFRTPRLAEHRPRLCVPFFAPFGASYYRAICPPHVPALARPRFGVRSCFSLSGQGCVSSSLPLNSSADSFD